MTDIRTRIVATATAALVLASTVGAHAAVGNGTAARGCLENKYTEVLRHVGFDGIDYEGLDFRGLNLGGVYFFFAQMRKADFSGAQLGRASFAGAQLEASKFVEARARRTVFRGSNLSYVDFRRADLRGADFSSANLTGANLRGAKLRGIIWENTICPDGTNSESHGGRCRGHLKPAKRS